MRSASGRAGTRKQAAFVRRSRPRSVIDWALVALLFGLCALLVVRLEAVSVRTVSGVPTVIDGDTIEVARQRIRLRGIDAFELGQSCRRQGKEYDCGAEARAALVKLMSGRTAECRGRTFDRYRRLVAVCGELNASLVSTGWAIAYGDFEREENAARRAKRGAWQGEFASPADWRAGRGEALDRPHGWLQYVIDLVRQLVAGR